MKKAVVATFENAKGVVTSERLECGHILDVRRLVPGKTVRVCPQCPGCRDGRPSRPSRKKVAKKVAVDIETERTVETEGERATITVPLKVTGRGPNGPFEGTLQHTFAANAPETPSTLAAVFAAEAGKEVSGG